MGPSRAVTFCLALITLAVFDFSHITPVSLKLVNKSSNSTSPKGQCHWRSTFHSSWRIRIVSVLFGRCYVIESNRFKVRWERQVKKYHLGGLLVAFLAVPSMAHGGGCSDLGIKCPHPTTPQHPSSNNGNNGGGNGEEELL